MERISNEEKEQQKKIHQAARALPEGRYRNLVYGFTRGFKFRRIERNHHMQPLPSYYAAGHYSKTDGYVVVNGECFFEHNLPSLSYLANLIQEIVPEVSKDQVRAWLEDRSGAIPAPPPRKKVFVRQGIDGVQVPAAE